MAPNFFGGEIYSHSYCLAGTFFKLQIWHVLLESLPCALSLLAESWQHCPGVVEKEEDCPADCHYLIAALGRGGGGLNTLSGKEKKKKKATMEGESISVTVNLLFPPHLSTCDFFSHTH